MHIIKCSCWHTAGVLRVGARSGGSGANTVGEGGRLAGIDVEAGGRKQRRTLRVQAVFSLLGAVPHTAWLPSEILTDQDGFIKTGRAILENVQGLARWPLKPQPLSLAAGDVRADSIKRVASAVAEGARAVECIRQYLKVAYPGG